ncbi:MAG: class II aldolase/adducin family protein [Gammaproteobacteria bacterium]
MSVTTLDRAKREARIQCSDAEWSTRCDLAALYRITHHLRMTDLIYTHLSARVPDEDHAFLINRYGDLFDEVTASSLVKVDLDGNPVGAEGHYNPAGFNIHSGAYLARPDVNCVMHTHTRAGIAVATTERGLLPLSQHALMVYDELGYHDYDGPGVIEERDAVGASCAKANCIVMRNHGLLTLGDSITGAFKRMYYLEQACQTQIAAQALNEPLRLIGEDVQQATAELWRERRASGEFGALEWASLTRMLDAQGADYRR